MFNTLLTIAGIGSIWLSLAQLRRWHEVMNMSDCGLHLNPGRLVARSVAECIPAVNKIAGGNQQ